MTKVKREMSKEDYDLGGGLGYELLQEEHYVMFYIYEHNGVSRQEIAEEFKNEQLMHKKFIESALKKLLTIEYAREDEGGLFYPTPEGAVFSKKILDDLAEDNAIAEEKGRNLHAHEC